MNNWKPIETIPKTRFRRAILGLPDGRMIVGYWDAYSYLWRSEETYRAIDVPAGTRCHPLPAPAKETDDE